MRKIGCTVFATLVLGISLVPYAKGQNVDLAKDLAEEGVTNEAKIEFLKVLHDPTKQASYDEAQYYLGYLSFKEQNYERALKHWSDLSKNYPSSPYAEKAKQQIQIAYQLLSKQQAHESENIEINGFFNDADFLIDDPLKVKIDTSYLPTGDMAIEMLDQIVTKYPQSPEAARALFREAEVLYGWGREARSQYSKPEGYGFEFCQYYTNNKGQAQLYIQKMVDVLHRLQTVDPTSPYAITVNYLIGQAYWSMAGGKTDENAKAYWQKVVDLAGEDKANSYRQIAEWRLKAH
jgi:outer membrane protein assembly factor BamD (BamD/ComL family)